MPPDETMEPQSGDSSTLGWGFWLMWVLACTVGWAVGGPAGVALSSSGGNWAWNIIVAGYLGLAIGGIITGMLQWLVLRSRLAQAGRWVPAGIVAVATAGVVVFGVGTLSADVGWVGGVALFGTVLGALQWLVLRGQVRRAGWWVLASTVGWVVGGPVAGLVGEGSWALLGAVYGTITGLVLMLLLRQRPLDPEWPSALP